MSSSIHSTAIVEAGAQIGEGCVLGPYCYIGGEVVLGDAAELGAHVWVGGRTIIGSGVQVFPFAALGGEPQHLQDRGEGCSLEVGNDTVVREHVTIHRGSIIGAGVTRIGAGCTFMAGTHAAHDCQVGENVLLNQGAILGGHVSVGDSAVLGAQSGVLQHVRIGRHAMVEAKTGVFNDVIPFSFCCGTRGHLRGINNIGLKKRGFPRDVISSLNSLLKRMFRHKGTLVERLTTLAQDESLCTEAREVVEFAMATDAQRKLMQPLDRWLPSNNDDV